LFLSCHANLEVLADYILALRESGIQDPQDFSNNLQDFLQDSTEAFVTDLINYTGEVEFGNVAIAESEVVEVDYEESSGTDAVSKLPLTRQLREYSPERRISEQSSTFTTNNKKPCSIFSKKGFCRFGDECRFAHIAPQQRHGSPSSRLKITNLSNTDLLNPEYLTNIMSKYGSVINLTVYPEKSEALVQFASGEEASRAVEGSSDDFDGNVLVKLENVRQVATVSSGFKAAVSRTLKPQFLQQQQQRHQQHQYHHQRQSPVSNEKLQSLITLQKQQQTLLETNLSTQQTLLNHLQSPNISAAERVELLSSLNKIQDSVMGVQEMLKRTTELVVESAGKTLASKPAFNGHNNNNNNNNYNNNSNTFHHHIHQNHQKAYTSNYNTRAFAFGNNTYIPGKSPANSTNYNPRRPNTLDLRPTTLKLASLKSTSLTSIHDLQRHFTPYGQIQSLIIADNGESAIIKYQKHGDAQKAFEKVSKEEGMLIEFVKQP
jgi:hypothetical protein